VSLEDPHAKVLMGETFFGEVFESVDIAEGFTDFVAVDGDEIVVQPN